MKTKAQIEARIPETIKEETKDSDFSFNILNWDSAVMSIAEAHNVKFLRSECCQHPVTVKYVLGGVFYTCGNCGESINHVVPIQKDKPIHTFGVIDWLMVLILFLLILQIIK